MKTYLKFFAFTLPVILGVFALTGEADAAKLYLFPPNETIYEGQSFMAEVRLDTEGEEINAAKIGIEVDKRVFQLEEFNNAGGIFTLYPEGPTLENGNITFQAAAPNGFRGNGLIGRIFLRAKPLPELAYFAPPGSMSDGQDTSGGIRFSSDSDIVLNDGSATSAELEVVNGLYTITERPENLPLVTSESHPSENIWRSGPFIRLDWEVKEGAYYSYKLTRNPNEGLDDTPDEPVGDIKLTTAEDGIFYFLLKECTSEGCGPIAKYRIFKDSAPPEPFDIKLGQDIEAYGGKRFLSFFAEDKASGIDHYEINTTGGERQENWKTVTSPYVLEGKITGKISVRAIDRAGNQRTEVFEPEKVVHSFNFILTAIIIIGSFVLLYSIYRLKLKRSR